MDYKVVKDFKDLKDNGHVYRAGDSFPRPYVNVDEGRIKELSTAANVRKEVLIKSVGKRKKKNAGADTEGDKELLHP